MGLFSKLKEDMIGKEKMLSPNNVESAESKMNKPKITVKCSKSNLIKGINLVLGAVPDSEATDISECILIYATTNKIKLLTNDLEFGIEAVIEGKVIEKGIVALDTVPFFEIICKLPDEEITINTDSNLKTTITCKKTQVTIIGKSEEEISPLTKVEKTNGIIVSQFELKKAIRQTIFSVYNGDNEIMAGELFEINDNTLKVVSLDGHRISIRNVNIKNSYIQKKVIISGKALNKISNILSSDMGKDVNIFFSNDYVLFEFDDIIAVSKLIKGEYYKIDNMLTYDYETKVIVKRQELLDCINFAMIFVGEAKPIIIEITDNMKLHIYSTTIVSMYTEIDTIKSGKDIVIGFNPKYLMDVLEVIDVEEVNLYMINPKAPCIIRDDENNYTYLILPVNFQNSQSTQTYTKPSETVTQSAQPQHKSNQNKIKNYNTYKEMLKQYYLQYGDEMLLSSMIQDFIESNQFDARLGITPDDVADDLREIRKMDKKEENRTSTPPTQPQHKAKPNSYLANNPYYANNSTQKQSKAILREQELFEIIKTMPLLIMNESNPSSNVNINSFCTKLVNLDIVSQDTSDSAIRQCEQNVANKRLRTSDKTEYHKRMEINLLFELFKYSYMLNVFESLKGRTTDTVNVDYDKFFSLAFNDCKVRVLQNLNQEIQKTPSIKKLLQGYYNNKTYPMPNIGTISNIENDYIVAFLMVGSLNHIMQYIFKADLQNTLQMINTYSGNEIKQTLDSYITQKCSMRLSMYAGDKWEWL